MQIQVSIKKPSEIHTLWRKQNLSKAPLHGNLFIFDLPTQTYFVEDEPVNVSDLKDNKNVLVEFMSEPKEISVEKESLEEAPATTEDPTEGEQKADKPKTTRKTTSSKKSTASKKSTTSKKGTTKGK